MAEFRFSVSLSRLYISSTVSQYSREGLSTSQPVDTVIRTTMNCTIILGLLIPTV